MKIGQENINDFGKLYFAHIRIHIQNFSEEVLLLAVDVHEKCKSHSETIISFFSFLQARG